METQDACDIVIVGAGLAGSAAATVLARRGLSVTVIDPYAQFPPLFRAEKIEPSQAALLRSLGLFDEVEPATRMIREIIHGTGGRVVRKRKIEQFGIAYFDIVNRVRAQMPPDVQFRCSRVQSIEPDLRQPSVLLVDGSRITCRLVIVASGMSAELTTRLGLVRNMVKEGLSLAFGFMLERTDGQSFAFDAVTYRPESTVDNVGYLTLFRMGQFMRGNLFVYWPPRDAATKQMLSDPVALLGRVMPGLQAVVGSYAVVGKVEPFKIDLYRVLDCALPGVVLIGDAYQSVCPSTGMGLSKVLTDVDALCNACIPEWLAGDEIGAQKTAAFYLHPQKKLIDDRALRLALAGRSSVLDTSLHWRMRRHIRAWRFGNAW